MPDLGHGSIVECIKNPQNVFLRSHKHLYLTVGALYAVERICSATEVPKEERHCPVDGCGGDYFILQGKGYYFYSRIAYCPNQFRPYGEKFLEKDILLEELIKHETKEDLVKV